MRVRAASFVETRRRRTRSHIRALGPGEKRLKFLLVAAVRGCRCAADATTRRSQSAGRKTLPSAPKRVCSLRKRFRSAVALLLATTEEAERGKLSRETVAAWLPPNAHLPSTQVAPEECDTRRDIRYRRVWAKTLKRILHASRRSENISVNRFNYYILIINVYLDLIFYSTIFVCYFNLLSCSDIFIYPYKKFRLPEKSSKLSSRQIIHNSAFLLC